MRWLRNLLFRKDASDELAEEMEQHIADRTAALIEQGRDPVAAASEARHAFGNITLARALHRSILHGLCAPNRALRLASMLFRCADSYVHTIPVQLHV